MDKIFKRIPIYLSLLVILMLCLAILTGCQSIDKSESYFDKSEIEYSRFEYDVANNQTKVIWATTLSNNTIYNFNGFSVTFRLYNNSTLIKTETYHYSRGVNHGKEYMGNFNFNDNGQIDSIEYVSWTADYDSFWNTYKIWFIVTIAIAVIASLIYIIIMIIEDLELYDVGDFLSDTWTIFFMLIIPFGGTIWGFITANWVSVLIVLGGIIAFVLILLLAHLIKFIIECIVDNVTFGGGRYISNKNGEDYFDTNVEEVSDYIDNRETLKLFSVEQLKDYCRKNEIRGFSSLNKSALIDLIVESNAREDFSRGNKPVKNLNSSISLNKLQHKITFEDIAGLEEAKKAFREKVVFAFEHKELYEKYGKKIGGGLLLYGSPGTGKTMFAEAASNETEALFIPIKCSDIKSKWYGESEANVKKIFEKARKAKKAIIFFDEFEAIGAKRSDNSENGNNNLVPQILAEMQGIGSSSGNSVIMVIAATNKPWAIDSAFLRPGRFDEKIYIPLPDFEARKKLFELKLKAIPQENLDYDGLATVTEGFNGADIGAFCDKLKMLAIHKSIEINAECPITMEEVKIVEQSIQSSVSTEDVERLLEFKDTYR